MTERRKQFPFDQFESKWQAIWEKNKTFAVANPGDADFDASKPKYFVLDMYPYPSGSGLHVGHPEGYTATDIIGRFKARSGYNVLHPMGWDAFGLPAEQHAIKTGEHPRINTANNIENFRRQLKSLGFAYDWDREINTTDPEYVKWTQWIFLQLYNSYFDEKTQKARPVSELEEQGVSRDEIDERRLAYVAETPVNWSPDLGTVLANEEVEEWRAKGHTVERRPLRQWMLRITAYAQRLIDELDDLDWPEGIKLLQKNWIGRSDGAEVTFQIGDQAVTVFTTRPDTLYGATYMVLAPEHPLVDDIASDEQIQAIADYRVKCGAKSDLERTELAKEKSGVFTGGYAVNPVNGEKIPVWIADYVLMSYGTGAIMAVPAHDQRDFEFAQQYDIPMIEVVRRMGFQPMDREENVEKKQGSHLPHWLQDGATYAVTFRLEDSLPASVIEIWQKEKDQLVASVKESKGKVNKQAASRLRQLFSEKVVSHLNGAHGECWLKDEALAELMKDALLHFDGQRYQLDAWCVMPNHVHVIVRPLEGNSLGGILHSWKSFTANKINKALGRSGSVWQAEYYDHLIRDEQEWREQIKYVQNNPEKAGLEGWKWVSSSVAVTNQGQDADAAEAVVNSENRSDITSTQTNHGQDAHATGDAHATCFSGEGIAINSPMFEGLTTAEAKEKICAWLEEKGLGGKTINYKMRDWLFSRQRYWGEPFPIVWRDGKHEALAESDLPLLAPELEDYKPSGTPEPLLSKATDWVNCGEGLKRETNTMPQWAGSCWYYLRYCDAKNSDRFVSEEAENYWMNVDLYIGGTEHAVLHLLYARFWHKVLHDLGHVSTVEPFQKLVNQGLIMGEDGVKMSKSRGNVVNPDDVVEGYGADALRLYEMFMGPLEQVKPWSMKGVEGVYRFLGRVWRLVMEVDQEGEWSMLSKVQETECDKKTLKVLHQTIKKVSEDIESLSFNTAISQMMVCTNELNKLEVLPLSAVELLLSVLNPFAPHLSEELYARLGEAFPEIIKGELSQRDWPQWEEVHLIEDEIEIVVQVNGKLRDRITISKDADKDEVEKLALDRDKVKEHIDGKTVRKVIVVPGRLVNVVAN